MIAYVLFVWVIPFVAAWIITIMTSKESRKNLNAMQEDRNSRSREIVNKINKDLIRTVVIVLSLFTITILPMIIAGIIRVLGSNQLCSSQTLSSFFFFSTYIFICGRFMNVIVYNVLNMEFKTALHKFTSNTLKFILCCKTN